MKNSYPPLLFCLLSLGLGPALQAAMAAEPGEAMAPSTGVKHRLLEEIAGLQEKVKLQAARYDEDTQEIARAHESLKAAKTDYDQAVASFGEQSQQAALSAQKVEQATQELYGRISDREHVRFTMSTLEQGIKQRRLSLSYQEGSKDISVWR